MSNECWVPANHISFVWAVSIAAAFKAVDISISTLPESLMQVLRMCTVVVTYPMRDLSTCNSVNTPAAHKASVLLGGEKDLGKFPQRAMSPETLRSSSELRRCF